MSGSDIIASLFNGGSYSSNLILAALGLAITFGVMRVINMAHGEMIMLGAYTGYFFTNSRALPDLVARVAGLAGMSVDRESIFGFEFDLFVALPCAFLVVGAVGFLLEVCLIRHLYTRPLDTLLATWGVGLVLQQVVRIFFGSDNRSLHEPSLLNGHIEIGDLRLGFFRIFIIFFTCVCLASVYIAFYRTQFGLWVRAVTQNREMASAMGISTRRVDSLTFAFGTGLAGVAGCIFGTLQPGWGPDLGTKYIVGAFMIVILGGMGQLTGTILAGLFMGIFVAIASKFLLNYRVDNSEMLAQVFVLALVIVLVLIRPKGLFAPKERSYAD